MGEYFIVVNKSKKQYIDAGDFGENIRLRGILNGIHGHAVGLLLVAQEGWHDLVGSWAGNEIAVLGDVNAESAYMNALDTYENISLKALGMLYECGGTGMRNEILEYARDKSEFLGSLWTIAEMDEHINLKHALKNEFGRQKKF